MTEDLMRYDLLAQRALRGVVRLALERAGSAEGIPGDHHFYIAFATNASGVSIPDHLRAEYPEEMTIVFKRQYWDLQIDEQAFSVTMSFHQQRQRLTVPFDAIIRFFDPTVNFGLAWPSPTATPGTEADRTADPEPPASDDAEEAAQVVSLDAFRKK